jgi:hypothetical protein
MEIGSKKRTPTPIVRWWTYKLEVKEEPVNYNRADAAIAALERPARSLSSIVS